MSKTLEKFQKSERVKDLTAKGEYSKVANIASYVSDSTKDNILKDYADFLMKLESDPEMAKVFQNFQSSEEVKKLTYEGNYKDLAGLAYMHGNTSGSNELRGYAEFLHNLGKKA